MNTPNPASTTGAEPQQPSAPRKWSRLGCLLRLILLCFGLPLVVLVLITAWMLLRPLPTPGYLTASPTEKTLVHTARPTAAAPATAIITTVPATAATTNTAMTSTTLAGADLIPESDFSDPAQRATAQRINDLVRRYEALLELSYTDPEAYLKTPEALKIDPRWRADFDYLLYPIIDDELFQAGIAERYGQAWAERAIHRLAAHQAWEPAIEVCQKSGRFNDMNCCLRQFPPVKRAVMTVCKTIGYGITAAGYQLRDGLMAIQEKHP